jgi:hypothetical protein
MRKLFFVITHYLGASQFGFGDVLMHTPLIDWAARMNGAPVAVGTIPEMEWIVERCPAAGSFEVVRSAADAARLAAGRLCLISDCSIDEYPYHEDGLSYTQLIAQRLGIDFDETREQNILYETTAADQASAREVLDQLGLKGPPIVTANLRGRTRSATPGLTTAEYERLLITLARETGAAVLVGDTIVRDTLVPLQTTLAIWAALIEMSALWIGECTGPYHLAAAFGTPTAMFSDARMDNRAWHAARYNAGENRVYVALSGQSRQIDLAALELASSIRSRV